MSDDSAGAGIKAYSSFAAGNERGDLEDMNAEIASQQAKSEMTAGSYNASLVRQRTAQTVGKQVSAIGADNLQQAGSPARVVEDTSAAGERSALQTTNNALRRAWGFEVQDESDQIQGGLARQGGILSGAGDIIGAF